MKEKNNTKNENQNNDVHLLKCVNLFKTTNEKKKKEKHVQVETTN